MDDPGLLYIARRLSDAAGLAPIVRVERLAGGKNNRVYRAEAANGEAFVLKSYFHNPADLRDRLGAEWSFLTYAKARGVRAVPEPLSRDEAAHAALYSFVPGRKLEADEIDRKIVLLAAEFIVAVNAEPRKPMALAPGSEACFSLTEHLETIERRVRRLDVLDEAAPYGDAVLRLVKDVLKPGWQKIRRYIETSGQNLQDRLTVDRICVSPSDFGFHNALFSDEDGLCFLDFEYAGRDDPAKLVCDFFNQPQVPVSRQHVEAFVARLAEGLRLSPADRERCLFLMDAYRVKWACIMLNDFLPADEARRAFALPGTRESRCREQLAKVSASLDALPSA